jgi:hypothetical protein
MSRTHHIAGLALSLLLTAAAGAACIPGSNPGAIQTELNAGRNAVLCQNAVFNITTPIRFTRPGTQLYTEGFPTGSTRAKIRIASSALTNAIFGYHISNIVIRNVIVDGGRLQYGYVRPQSDALIMIGGNASGQQVSYVEAFEPRGWSALQVYNGDFSWNGTAWTGGCTGARIENNFIHDAGETNTWSWADGLSFACRNSYAGYNTIQDATDGDIVIFGSPGSIVEFNTVRNTGRNGIGGIVLVDTTYRRNVVINGTTYDVGDFSGTIVRNNTVEADDPGCGQECGLYLYIGIAMGPRTWWCSPANGVVWVYGAKVLNNHITGNAMQAGIVADGVLSWEATGNTSSAFFWNFTYGSSCGGSNLMAAFVRHATHATGTFQSNFSAGQGHHAHPF